jgi:hypothetical protein
LVQFEEVPDTSAIPPPNCVRRNIVATRRDPFSDAFHSEVGRRQPEEKEMNGVP